MDEQTIRARLARLEQLRAQRGQLNAALQVETQHLAEEERAKQELDALAQEWHSQLDAEHAHSPLVNQTRDELMRRHATLQNELQQWKAGTSKQPSLTVSELTAEIDQVNAKLERTRQIALRLNQIEQFVPRVETVEQRRALGAQVAAQKTEWERERSIIPASVGLHTELLEVEQALQARQELRNRIVDTIRYLTEALPKNSSSDWLDLAFAESQNLYAQLGSSIQQLEAQTLQLDKETQALERQVDARELQVAPVRAKVAELQEMEQQHLATFRDESLEIQLWSKKLASLGLQVPEPTDEFLAPLRQELEAKAQALSWFDTTAQ